MTPFEPGSARTASDPKTGAPHSISDAERELYGSRLGMVLRTGWKADRHALTGVVAVELGQGVTAVWGGAP